YASQIFWMLLIFGFVFFVIGRGMVPKVMDTVSVRDKQIAEDLAAAEAARNNADAEEQAWRSRENDNRANAQVIIAKAKADAAKSTEAKLAEAGSRVDARIAEADARIGAARDSALGEIETVATEAANDIVRRIAGIEVDENAARVAVKEALNG
ncbi:MAG TPA: ATPase, partial [Novosphingobium sp.]|nr:ATPase [Novosphingobium sp.]